MLCSTLDEIGNRFSCILTLEELMIIGVLFVLNTEKELIPVPVNTAIDNIPAPVDNETSGTVLIIGAAEITVPLGIKSFNPARGGVNRNFFVALSPILLNLP